MGLKTQKSSKQPVTQSEKRRGQKKKDFPQDNSNTSAKALHLETFFDYVIR
jgi:hypothetical protein